MGFWDTFAKVWQVRFSIKIQESLEGSIREGIKNAERQANLPDIIDELQKKSESWEQKITHHRNKTKK